MCTSYDDMHIKSFYHVSDKHIETSTSFDRVMHWKLLIKLDMGGVQNSCLHAFELRDLKIELPNVM